MKNKKTIIINYPIDTFYMSKYIVIIGFIILLLFGGIYVYNIQRSKISVKPSIQNTNNKNALIKQPYPSPAFRIVPTSTPIVIPLEIVSPKNIGSVSTDSIIVSGTTVPYADVMINNFEITADVKGKFTQTINLDEGENYISVIAYTESGVAEKEIIILRDLLQ